MNSLEKEKLTIEILDKEISENEEENEEKEDEELKKEKRIFVLDLLQLLQDHTDKDNPITQQEIREKLAQEYSWEKARPTIRSNMENLIRHAENDLAGSQIYDRVKWIPEINAGKDSFTNFYYNHLFSHDELIWIIDSVLFSKHLSQKDRKAIIKKLESLSNQRFKSRLTDIDSLTKNEPIGEELFHNIKVLNEAIEAEQKVSFFYHTYDVNDKKEIILLPRKDDEGLPREYIINPYRMVAANDRYYLVCNNDKYDNLSHYRIDRMTEIEMIDEARKPFQNLTKTSFDLAEYMQQRIYMFAGDSRVIRMKFKRNILSEFIDWFGTEDITFQEITDEEMTVSVRVNENDVRHWALQYGLFVTVLGPEDLVEQIKEDIQEIAARYDLK